MDDPILESWKVWVELGGDGEQFYRLTPSQTLVLGSALGRRVSAEMKQTIVGAWHAAAFTRAKRMPGLHKIIGDTEPKPKSGKQIFDQLKLKFGANANG